MDSLKKLCLGIGVAGNEISASQIACEMLKEYTDDIAIDAFDNVIGYINKDKEELPLLLLDAHIDEIGMMVTYIDDNGFIKVSSCGGVDRRLLAAQEVTIHGKKDVLGIVGSKPPHLEKGDDAKKIPQIDEIFIDVGMGKEKASEVISLGDRVSINSGYHKLLNDRVSVKALDDRAGVLSILKALELVKGKALPYRVAVIFSSQEEVGGTGAAIGAYNINPDVAIAVDVSFAYTSDAIEHKCGKMGQGVMIGYAPVLNKQLSDTLLAIAKRKEIPYQIEVMGGRTSTNADELSISRSGIKTALLSIPLKYMHTPVESCQISDIDSVAQLISAFILVGGN